MKVTLLKDGHTHAGKPCKKGDEIEVTEGQAAWLADPKRGLIAPITKNPAKAPATQEG